jgi:peptidoglycan/LPS O-acetylase OafA/YrhL
VTVSEHPDKSNLSVAYSSVLPIPELQLLRAAGCCLVFLAHVLVLIYPERFMGSIDTPAGELFARAVIGFFILSGLVLSLPFVGENEATFHTGRFYTERFLRLYPAYFVSVLFALGMRAAISHWVGFSNSSPWVQRFWTEPITGRSLLEHVLALSITSRNINPVYWTLSLEIQACLLLPLIIFLVRRTRHWRLALVPIVALTVLFHYFPQVSLIRTVSYFLMGAYVAKYNSRSKAFTRNLPAAAVLGAVVLTIAFFWLAPRSSVSYRLSFLVLDGGLAVLMVAVQVFRPLAMLSNLRPVQRFAELSYCFYLFHLPILAACAVALRPIVQSAPLTIFAAFSLSLLVASAAHRFVEQPIRAFVKARASSKSIREFAVPAIAISERSAAATQFRA